MNSNAFLRAIAAALVLGACAPVTAQENAAAKVFDQRCTKCHSFEKLAPGLAKRNAADRIAYLEKFLQKHFPPPVAERRPLAEYLANRAGK